MIKKFEIPYSVEQILRDNCPIPQTDQLASKQKLVLRSPQEPSEAELVYTVIDVGPYMQRLMLETEPPKIKDIPTTSLAGLCRQTDLMIKRALYENLALARDTANTALERFLRPTTK